eukprot:m51a1_g10367 hypothetical protein (437) ;mRNA; r:87776-89769
MPTVMHRPGCEDPPATPGGPSPLVELRVVDVEKRPRDGEADTNDDGAPHGEATSAEPTSANSATPPSLLLVHGALLAVQVCFGANAVVGKLGMSEGTNPVFFALLREAIAGPVLLAFASAFDRRLPAARDLWLFGLAGGCLFVNQLCYIVGLKLADTATTAALWQMTQPVFTTVIALSIRWERATAYNVVGILLSVGGACFMVLYGKSGSSMSSSIPANICFFLNCLATSLYVIASKPLLKSRGYRPTTVIGWAYVIAALMMLVANAVVDFWRTALNKLCSDCDGSAFHMSAKALGALASAVVLGSLLSYSLLTWANKVAQPTRDLVLHCLTLHSTQWADATIVSAYLVVQPLTTAVLCSILNAAGVDDMDKPGLNDLGAIPIVVGLSLIIFGQYRNKKLARDDKEAESEPAKADTKHEASQATHEAPPVEGTPPH